MNSAELLDQFITEARECLEHIGRRLLDVEKNPGDAELLNDLFRQVHTLKGNCGLFDFKPLERVVHAGEDLLDRVRNGRLAYTTAIADALLEAMDYTAELVDTIAAEGGLNDAADGRAQALAQALRQHLDRPAQAARTGPAPLSANCPTPTPATAGASAIDPAATHEPGAEPAWLLDLPAELRRPGILALRYRPEAECFFKGEDPWRLARQTPGLVHLSAGPAAPWPAAADFDCYRCNLQLLIATEATPASVEEHFRYVPEQLEWHLFKAEPGNADARPAEAAGQAAIRERVLQLWDDQRALLARPGVAAGAVASARRAFEHLLLAWGDDETTALARAGLAKLVPGAAPLAGWAQQHPPGGCGADTPATPGSPLAAPPEPRRGAARGAADEPAAAGPRVLKVAQEKVDHLMELIGEMVVAKNALPYLADRAETVFHQRELAREIKTQYAVINRIAEDMQHAIMQVRMLPMGTIFQRFGRLVRDISKRLGKDVQLIVEGEDTEADKNVIESLADPLIHILRNSLDHGLERPEQRLAAGKPPQGTLRVAARQEGDRVLLDISDDGAGIDTARVRFKAVERGLIPADRAELLTEEEAVQLVFLPGFSTAESISDLSGRGVGMDVVRSAVERINGSVALSSVRGQGTTIQLALPLSMAVTHVMMVETAGRRFGVPMDLIVETVRVPAEDIHRFKEAQTVVLRGRIVPLRALCELLALDGPPRLNDVQEHAVLVIRLGTESIGLLIDDFHGTSDIILKPMDGVLAGLTGFAGTALMGDGSVLMVLNPKELL